MEKVSEERGSVNYEGPSYFFWQQFSKESTNSSAAAYTAPTQDVRMRDVPRKDLYEMSETQVAGVRVAIGL